MIIVLGGGISGLSAAYYAANNAKNSAVILLEASSRVGGWIRSRKSPTGAIFEQGPRTVKPVGLASSLKGIFKTISLLDRPLINCLWTDLTAPKISKEDESIYNFVQRRLGQDIADNLISPLICGICAGDARKISVNFLFKSLFEAEQKYGSIVKGVLANRLKNIFFKSKNDVIKENNADSESTSLNLTLADRALKERWALWGLEGGLEQLPQALANNLRKQGVKIQTEAKCEKLTFKSNHIELLINGNIQECSRVISSLPARNLAELVREQHPTLSAELAAIPTVTVGVINFEFQKDILPLQAFGFLVPPKENLPLLGVIFDSCVFPQKSSTVLTVMMGGAWFEKYFGPNPSKEHLLTTAIHHTKNILHIEEEPVAHNIAVLKDCIPQHVVGHTQRIKRIHNYIFAHHIPLGLCGSSYQGVGLNDVILSAKQAVCDIVQ